jgi:hypothetical protein
MRTVYFAMIFAIGCNSNNDPPTCENDAGVPAEPPFSTAPEILQEGRQTFRFDTFGDEGFWGDQLKLHQAIAGSTQGGVGTGLSPRSALQLGLKVDVEKLPANLQAQLQANRINLDDPASTLALLRSDAVVGVIGRFDGGGALTSVGITCALCHSTVDDSFAPGIGRRLDAWPNRDINVGAIIALAPDLSPISSLLELTDETVRTVLLAWGPGKFDAELLLDGKGFRPDGQTAATLIPPAFGLAGVNLHTWTGWGSVPYWNAFVANIEMHGKGNFYDPRLNALTEGGTPQFPIAVKAGFANIRNETDLITPKLPALHVYQLAIPAPSPPPGSFDSAAAQRGSGVFTGAGKCATCHVPPLFTEPGWNLHTAAEIGIDDFQAQRSPDRRYRTVPLQGLFVRLKGGFYHDGRFPTLEAVVDHYESVLSLSMTADAKRDLVEYLKSL